MLQLLLKLRFNRMTIIHLVKEKNTNNVNTYNSFL